ncbi:MAG TPA: hypothetical protein VFV34_14950 [Blastocatellia bacterium]|nr:hypothetical protein [Blastocatellia bacterium]
MLNILSINCSLAFTPYLLESLAAFVERGEVPPQLVRQGGGGLLIRSDERLVVRYRNREVALETAEAEHYIETLNLRSGCFDVVRLVDEVVLATIGNDLLLSHPQSEMWLAGETVSALISTADSGPPQHTPDWLSVSTGGGRLLLSDQRNGRWVLLGAEHLQEFSRRSDTLIAPVAEVKRRRPPTVSLKGITIPLQAAPRLARTLGVFASTREFTPYEEIAPHYALRVAKTTEGIEISDSNNRVSLTASDAGKWREILAAELVSLEVTEMRRGTMRTVFASAAGGRWVMQWGDEVFIEGGLLSHFGDHAEAMQMQAIGDTTLKKTERYMLVLDRQTSTCVALTTEEVEEMARSTAGDGRVAASQIRLP